MELVSSRDAIEFLSKSAPRSWVKRMLLGMIYEGELEPFITAGKSFETTAAIHLTHQFVGPLMTADERAKAIRDAYPDHDFAELLVASNGFEKIRILTMSGR